MIEDIHEIEELELRYRSEEADADTRFKLSNEQQASWAFQKMIEAKKEEQKVSQLAQDEKARIESWEKTNTEKHKRQYSFFESLIIEFLTDNKVNDPDFEINTPFGKAKTVKQRPKWIYKDDEIIKWAKESNQDDIIRVKEQVDKRNLKATFSSINKEGSAINPETGEIAKGVSVVTREEKIKIDLGDVNW